MGLFAQRLTVTVPSSVSVLSATTVLLYILVPVGGVSFCRADCFRHDLGSDPGFDDDRSADQVRLAERHRGILGERKTGRESQRTLLVICTSRYVFISVRVTTREANTHLKYKQYVVTYTIGKGRGPKNVHIILK